MGLGMPTAGAGEASLGALSLGIGAGAFSASLTSAARGGTAAGLAEGKVVPGATSWATLW